ncbi:MAG: nucleoside triphosphate pyrophosphohydrolase [Candidatus Cloacimonetes bacterium HGW-Cloacimonetes-1]|jgi:tetrapyrrole methylase family protein/MazG family protein|nr:MAG: nucleoside triphosphate pyrophosphohydrolase [Candidatus Cloacimonetes bacterium HGW-Cloacimonetes-1]
MQDFKRLIDIVSQLRDPIAGCPWDVKQTPESLVPNLIEELYEVVEAIEDQDSDSLSEELGDLMLHIVFQVQIAEEEGRFDMVRVLNKINSKLVRRHPHVFGELRLDDADAVKMNWERIKKVEKTERKSVLEGIPRALPALIYAQRTQEKAASVGFDWQDIAPVLEKLTEEEAELREALEENDGAHIREELGDMLFTLVNLARKLHIDAEAALKETTRKFSKRFNYIEEHYSSKGEDINEASLEELDAIWDLAKKH